MSETRRINKKVQRCLAALRRHEPQVRASLTPTNILYVANGGVVCGVTHDELYTVFNQYGLVQTIHVFPNSKPYVFVVYEQTCDAERAMTSLHATHPAILQHADVILYLIYVTNLPDRCVALKDKPDGQYPPGLHLIPEFVSEQEANELWDFVQGLEEPKQTVDGSALKHRVVHHFGYTFDYKTAHALSHAQAQPAPIPLCCTALVQRGMQTGLIKHTPDQLTINLYSPGQGIASHTDTHSAFEDSILSISLLSDVVMEFKSDTKCIDVLLPARSLCVMTGQARYVYKHGIAARKYDVSPVDGCLLPRNTRCSFTLRAVRTEPCACAFASSCDHVRDVPDDLPVKPSTQAQAQLLEQLYVTDVYDSIASHFDQTRHSQWRGIAAFLDSVPAGSTLLDVGCGNGKYLWPTDRRPLIRFGCDLSVGLCRIASSKQCSVVQANVLHVPFCQSRFDACICIAVIHHMSTHVSHLHGICRRVRAIEQLMKVLRVGGQALVSVWAYEQRRHGKDSSYLHWGRAQGDSAHSMTQPNAALDSDGHGATACTSLPVPALDSDGQGDTACASLPVHTNLTPFKQQDVLVPWVHKTDKDQDGGTHLRFYHVFREGELDSLCGQVHNCRVESVTYEQGNWIALLTKTHH